MFKGKKGDKFSKGRRPSYLSRKQAELYERERVNFNRRINYQVKKWQKLYPKATAEELSRLGIVPWKVSKTVNQLKNKKEYMALKKLFKHTKTKAYKNKLTRDMRDRLMYVVDESYFPSPELRKEIWSIINKMSSDELVKFSYDNSTLINDLYHVYTENKDTDWIDADTYETKLDKFVTALRLFKK